ncbi:hypothetical protein TPHA_0A03350 [Tetrapisispora phaffii CBS 4417]|uniref:ADF-H domain-containing protein n=1 Tax=Tetrapisispora phaffii (strain ATCC 24235 / CBS 4417 / NBRC 1672 / NRRL Y-8282 / UCD 70-5) TaxID=1071381 RepID=G8BND4_TETPH|nr:hypothetical protein TPHA_0A03350 [Tetrapisispora phaffii CBS 4417]CCE61412.1 hypothetical protein TPHA_0A03350 [Tetrapisispora phaffii CBS 4417]
MSTQSGITADKALLDKLATDASEGVIIIVGKISDDLSIVEFKGTHSSIDELKANLTEEPSYIFIKDSNCSKPDQYQFISYVPDESHVRLKMIYASTKNTIVRQIGTNSIDKQLLFTEPSEFTDDLFNEELESTLKNLVLSESEKSRIMINEQQREMRMMQSQKLVSQNNGTASSLTFNVNIENNQSIKDLLSKDNVISFKIDTINENVEILNTLSIEKPEELVLTVDHPSYTLYKNGDLIYFIYCCPSGSKVKDRMLYASNRLGFINYLNSTEKIELVKTIEIGEPEELEISLISNSSFEQKEAREEEEKKASQNSSTKFSRPKGPSRKKRM